MHTNVKWNERKWSQNFHFCSFKGALGYFSFVNIILHMKKMNSILGKIKNRIKQA